MNFSELVHNYANTEEHNNFIHEYFSKSTTEIDWLYQHRLYVEKNNLGFGDVAFHYMWLLLLKHFQENITDRKLEILEIGVFKGQVISLWDLISQKIALKSAIHAISPFKGKPEPKSKLLYKLLVRFNKRFRKIHESSNFYDDENYHEIITNHFHHHGLDFKKILTYTGFSTDKKILNELKGYSFDLIYIDGDHTFDTVIKDINNYAPLITPGGFLVMDDASNNIPGSTFWKGHQQVSDAAEIIPALGFSNILNVGHNRIYQKAYVKS